MHDWVVNWLSVGDRYQLSCMIVLWIGLVLVGYMWMIVFCVLVYVVLMVKCVMIICRFSIDKVFYVWKCCEYRLTIDMVYVFKSLTDWLFVLNCKLHMNITYLVNVQEKLILLQINYVSKIFIYLLKFSNRVSCSYLLLDRINCWYFMVRSHFALSLLPLTRYIWFFFNNSIAAF